MGSYEEQLQALMHELFQADGETDFSGIPQLMADLEEFMNNLQALQCRSRNLLTRISQYDKNNYEGFLISNAGEFEVDYVDTFEECVEALHEVRNL